MVAINPIFGPLDDEKINIFIDNIILVYKNEKFNIPQVTVKDAPEVAEAARELIITIRNNQEILKKFYKPEVVVKKEVSEKNRKIWNNYKKVLKYIQKYPDVQHLLGIHSTAWVQHHTVLKNDKKLDECRWSLDSRIVILNSLLNLYKTLSEFPNELVNPKIYRLLEDEDGLCYKIIKCKAQIRIVYEIYIFTGFTNPWGMRYGDKDYKVPSLDYISEERNGII